MLAEIDDKVRLGYGMPVLDKAPEPARIAKEKPAE